MKPNRIFALSLAAVLSLTLLTGCTTQEEAAPAVTVPSVSGEVTPDPLPEVAPELDEETPVAPLPDEELPPAVEEEPASGDIVLSRTDFTLFSAGEQYQLTLSNLLDSDSVTFASSDDTVATVDEDGTVTAVNSGTATVTATILLDGITAVDRSAIVRCSFEETSLDFISFYEELAAASDYQGGMMLVDDEMLRYSYPTLFDYEFVRSAIYMPMMSAVASELAFIEVLDEADVDTAKAVLQARIDAQIAGGAWYPATIEGWEKNARIVVHGTYLMLAVGENVDDVVAAFDAQF